MAETWDLLQSTAGSAAFNMALDEVLLRSAENRGRPLLRVYRWEKPSVSFGYFQKFPAHFAERYAIVRRPTGGGLVYHGDGVDTTYTVVAPSDHRLYTMSTTDAYCAIHKAVVAALAESCARVSDPAQSGDRRSPEMSRRPAVSPRARSGDLRTTNVALFNEELHRSPSPRTDYECFQQPVAGDVVADGRKLAGGAQRRNKHGMLHQGSIAARVTAEQLVHGFTAELGARFEPYALIDAERLLAERLVREKYATDKWNRRIS